MHLKARSEFGSEFFNSLCTELNLSTNLTEQVVYWNEGPQVCFSQSHMRMEKTVFPLTLHLLLWIKRCLCREKGVRNKALHSSHWNGLSSEWVCGWKTTCQSKGPWKSISCHCSNYSEFSGETQEGLSQLEASGDEELKYSFCHYSDPESQHSSYSVSVPSHPHNCHMWCAYKQKQKYRITTGKTTSSAALL